jgi:hypothetical protein
MKKFIKNLVQFLLVSYLVVTLFEGIQLPENLVYVISSLVILSFGMLMASPIIKFLTIKENFITFFLMSSLILTGLFFLLDIFMTGFYIEAYTFEGMEMGTLIINSFEVVPILTMTLCSICSSFLGSLLYTLEKTS